jgi:hypothetical protein
MSIESGKSMKEENEVVSICGERHTIGALRDWAVNQYGCPYLSNGLFGFAFVFALTGLLVGIYEIRNDTGTDYLFWCGAISYFTVYHGAKLRKGFLFMTHLADEETKARMNRIYEEKGYTEKSGRRAAIIGVLSGASIVGLFFLLCYTTGKCGV